MRGQSSLKYYRTSVSISQITKFGLNTTERERLGIENQREISMEISSCLTSSFTSLVLLGAIW